MDISSDLSGLEIAEPQSRSSKIERQYVEKRNILWPRVEANEDLLLWGRSRKKGFTTIPRTLPLIMKLMDSIGEKGKPTSNTYFAIWCRTYNTNFLEIKNKDELIDEAGFGGTRKVSVWKARMKILSNLGFIKSKQGVYGEYSQILLLNPFLVLFLHHKDGRIAKENYDVLRLRCAELASDDCASLEKLNTSEIHELRKVIFDKE